MTLDEVMKALEAAGTAQNRKVYGRHGVRGAMFGVSYSALGSLKKKIKTDQALAEALWATGNHDARVLACMISDPAKISLATINGWAKSLDNYVVTDAFSGLVAKSPHGWGRVGVWIKSRQEWIAAAGWNVVSGLAITEGGPDDDALAALIPKIESGIGKAPNRTRHSMNNALIAIGCRSEALAKLATAAAGRIGKVAVDHGETNCKTPDAAIYIAKTRAHYAKKGGITKRKRC